MSAGAVLFLGALIKWQEFVLSLVMHERFSGTLAYGCGSDSSAAIPWPVGLDWNRPERSERALSQVTSDATISTASDNTPCVLVLVEVRARK